MLALACVRIQILFLFFRFLRLFLWFGETQRLQLFDRSNLPGGQSFALGLKTFDADKLFDIDFLCSTIGIITTIGYQQTRIDSVRQQNLL